MVLTIAAVRAKIHHLDETLHAVLSGSAAIPVPSEPARDVEVLKLSELPPKLGLSLLEGQARLIHDLANIELQAMELGVRTLLEFPDAPNEFRQELALITRGEGEHLGLCLDALEELGYRWGDWPVHNALWKAVSSENDFIDRILIVHRHLEGAGLDSGESILRRLNGVKRTAAHPAVERIVREEVGHVLFGSQWYREACRLQKRDPDHEFRMRMPEIARAIPRRDRIATDLRRSAGFSEAEIDFLADLQKNLPGIPPRDSRTNPGGKSERLA